MSKLIKNMTNAILNVILVLIFGPENAYVSQHFSLHTPDYTLFTTRFQPVKI